MLIAAFGMPGALSSWGFAALQAMARHNFGDHAVVAVDTLDGLLTAMAEHPAVPILLTSQYPQPGLAAFVQQHAIGSVVFLERPDEAVSYLAQVTGETELAIIRAVSASCACLASLPNMGTKALIRRSKVEGLAAGDVLRRISDAVGLRPIAADDVPELTLAMYPAPGEHASQPPDVDALPALAHSSKRLAEEVLAPFGECLLDGSVESFSWPHECFLRGDEPGQLLQGAVDLTGAARCIIYGPYLHLPVGYWTARIVLGFDDCVYDQSFALELHGPGLLGRVRVNAPARSGLFAAEIGFAVAEPHVPLEMRVLTELGAIEGSIYRVNVSFT